MTTAVHVTDNSFDPEVLKCDIPVLANFWAEWAGPSQNIETNLDIIGARYPGRLKIVQLDLEANPVTTNQYNVLHLPTLILFKHGLEVERISGIMDRDAILEKVTPHLDQ